MKNKKGFTIIEIIVSLTLVLLIGGIVIGLNVTNNKKKEEKIIEVTKKIQEAAGVYLAVNKEIDDSIEQNILKGGSGYVIPLKILLEEGYIGDKHIKTLEDNGVKINLDKEYMLAAVFSNTNHCDNNESTISIQASYQLENNVNYYLCNFTTEEKYLLYDLDGGYFTDNSEHVRLYPKGSNVTLKAGTSSIVKKDQISNISYSFKEWNTKKNCQGHPISDVTLNDDEIVYACYEEKYLQKKVTLQDMIQSAKFSKNIGKSAVSQNWCNNNAGHNSNIVCDENGIFLDYDKKNKIAYYYFRGAVENNYVSLAGKLWRILWINSENKAKLILDDSLKIKVNNLNGNTIELGKDATIANFYIADIKNRPTDSRLYDRANKIPREYFILNENDQNKSIYSLLKKCSDSGVDCTSKSGENYIYPAEYTYQNLNKSTYIQSYSLGGDNIIDYSLYKNAYNDFSNYLKTDSVFNELVPNDLNWYYYTKNYNNEKSVYYKKHGCNCNNSNSCCYNNNFSSSYEVDEYSYEKNEYVTGRIGLINYHELNMAGITSTTVLNSDNFLIKNNNSNFLIAEYNKKHSSGLDEEDTSEKKFGYRWYYVNGNDGNISNYQIRKYLSEEMPNIIVRTYEQNKTLDSCATTKQSRCTSTKNSDGTLILGPHTYDYFNLYSFEANTIRPVIEIMMGNYKLSESDGTKMDPYLLVK